MYYRYECVGSNQSNSLVSQYIEPLIGLLRDPLTFCSYGNRSAGLRLDGMELLQSKRFLLLLGLHKRFSLIVDHHISIISTIKQTWVPLLVYVGFMNTLVEFITIRSYHYF